MSDEIGIGAHDREAIRKLVNDKIAGDLSSKDTKKQGAAANAAWKLAELDQKTNKGQLSQEQYRTYSMALSQITTSKLSTQTNPYTQKAMSGETLADLQKRLNDFTTGKKPLPPVESLYIRTEISRLSPNQRNMSSALTNAEVAWLAQEAEERHRELNKFLISVAGPVASPFAATAALMNAPAKTVSSLLEAGVGFTAAGGLPSRMVTKSIETSLLEPVSRGYSVSTTKSVHNRATLNTNSLKVEHTNGNFDYDAYMFEPTVQNIADQPQRSTNKSPDKPHRNTQNHEGYRKGVFENTIRELEKYEARVNDLNEQISKLRHHDEAAAKEGIRRRVVGYFHDNLPLLEKAKTQMKHDNIQQEAQKTEVEIRAYEARECLLSALNIPVIKNGELVPRSNIAQSSQTIVRLQAEYEQKMEALWPQDIPTAFRAKAPILFKSDKLNNVYHNTNPTGEKINCVSCAEALAESIKGFPTSANRYNNSLYHQVNNDILIKAHNIPQQNIHHDLAGVEKQMLQWGDGAIAIIAGKRDTFTGHNFLVVNDAGNVRFLDRQADNELFSPKGTDFSEIALIRVDTPTQRRAHTSQDTREYPAAEYNPFAASANYNLER